MDPKDIKSTQDREHFRIDDEIIVQMYVPLVTELSLTRNQILDKLCEEKESQQQQAISQLQKLSDDIDKSMTEIMKNDSTLANHLKLLDSKINVLSSLVVERASGGMMKVNISTGGIGFAQEQEFAMNTIVYFKLTIPPQNYTVITKARVVNCRYLPKKNAAKPFYIGFQFIDLDKTDERFLNKHILDKQIELRNKYGRKE